VAKPGRPACTQALALGGRGPGWPEGHVCWPPDGAFFRARDLESNVFGSRLLLADIISINYGLNHKGTKAQRMHKRDSWRSSSFAILAAHRQQRQAAAGPRAGALRFRLLHVGRAVRACGACRQGGLDCQTGARAWARRRPVGLRARWRMPSVLDYY
jgi:hypothetical protein